MALRVIEAVGALTWAGLVGAVPFELWVRPALALGCRLSSTRSRTGSLLGPHEAAAALEETLLCMQSATQKPKASAGQALSSFCYLSPHLAKTSHMTVTRRGGVGR